jgi:predicted CXXCH cytochrome family protein
VSGAVRYSLLAAVLLVIAEPSLAQLISPGKLFEAHARLEGITNCTTCHSLGQRGIEPAKCLACHTPLRARVRAGEGFHATVSTDCATCHKDHFGRDFDPIRLDTDAFDHRDTGYPLLGEHARADCRSCHKPELVTDADVRAFKLAAGRLDRTYLGLADDCATCHRADNPHGAEFARADCAACHEPTGWDEVADFDHAETGFALVGQHAALACTACHGEGASGAVQFTGVRVRLRELPPAGQPARDAVPGPGLRELPRRTDVEPRAALRPRPRRLPPHRRPPPRLLRELPHNRQRADAVRGHRPRDLPELPRRRPRRRLRLRLRDVPHDRRLAADGPRLRRRPLRPRRPDRLRPRWRARGARLCDLSCPARSQRRGHPHHLRRRPARRELPAVLAHDCQSCHKDYHDGAFADRPGGSDCASCHESDGWLPTSFGLARHDAETAFPLTGAHLATPCFACHGGADGPPHFAFESTACESCHAEDNPHGDQFTDEAGVTVCGGCHATDGWDLASFDHSTTGFALVGAHAALACQSCHTPTTAGDGRLVHQFAGLDAECTSCHADDSPHAGQFEETSCATCHDTQAFTIATFDHDATAFPLDGAHERVACGSCHRTETAPSGEPFVRFKPLGTACADCHGGGG